MSRAYKKGDQFRLGNLIKSNSSVQQLFNKMIQRAMPRNSKKFGFRKFNRRNLAPNFDVEL